MLPTIALLGLLLFPTLPLAPAGYVPAGNDKGVTVWRHDGSRLIELYAEGILDAPPERVRQVLLDYGRHPAWLKKLRTSRVLARDDHSELVYQRLDLPILDDRDFTLRVTWGQDGASLWTHFQTDNARGPGPQDGAVRIWTHEGGWRLDPIDGGRRTFARYTLRLDLAGSLPGWMARGGAAKDVPELFQGIRSQLH